MMHVKATITAIDTAPEFADVTGDEATMTVVYSHPQCSNAPAIFKTIGITADDARRFRVGQVIPFVHV